MSQQTQHSSANLLQQISKQRRAGSPFTSHAGVSIYAHPDVTPKPSDKHVSRRSSPTTKPAASKKANGPIVEDNCSNEPFISAPAPKDSLPRYCAQIRRRTNDGPINLWSDLNVMDRKILVRDMKHPYKKKGNNVWGETHAPSVEDHPVDAKDIRVHISLQSKVRRSRFSPSPAAREDR